MKPRHTTILLIVAIIGMMAVGWLIIGPPEPADIYGGVGPDFQMVPLPTENYVELREATKPPRVASYSIPDPSVEPDANTSSLAQDKDGDPYVAETPLLVPDYGPAIKRSGSSAVFKLIDSAGVRCWMRMGVLGVHLWRKLGPYWTRDVAYYDESRSEIICEGLSGTGLEPGEYELEILGGGYGDLTHRFLIDRAEKFSGTLMMPNYARVITLHFIDQDGRDVPYITNSNRPSYEVEFRKQSSDTPRPENDFSLRSPPELDGIGGSGRGGSSLRRAYG